ncbi:hypothetical protein Q7P36_011330 [Cladosporium allicinum]
MDRPNIRDALRPAGQPATFPSCEGHTLVYARYGYRAKTGRLLPETILKHERLACALHRTALHCDHKLQHSPPTTVPPPVQHTTQDRQHPPPHRRRRLYPTLGALARYNCDPCLPPRVVRTQIKSLEL